MQLPCRLPRKGSQRWPIRRNPPPCWARPAILAAAPTGGRLLHASHAADVRQAGLMERPPLPFPSWPDRSAFRTWPITSCPPTKSCKKNGSTSMTSSKPPTCPTRARPWRQSPCRSVEFGVGQVYLVGDGRLGHWDIFNERIYRLRPQQLSVGPLTRVSPRPVLRLRPASDGKTIRKRLDASGFGPKLPFPEDIRSASLIAMPTCSRSPSRPFRPSSRPTTPLTRCRRHSCNTPSPTLHAPIEVRLAGWLENGVCLKSRTVYDGRLVNRALRADGLAMAGPSAEARPRRARGVARESIVIADFEGGDYGQWTVEGEAFGKGPRAARCLRSKR